MEHGRFQVISSTWKVGLELHNNLASNEVKAKRSVQDSESSFEHLTEMFVMVVDLELAIDHTSQSPYVPV